jgi:hypothetical protein
MRGFEELVQAVGIIRYRKAWIGYVDHRQYDAVARGRDNQCGQRTRIGGADVGGFDSGHLGCHHLAGAPRRVPAIPMTRAERLPL